MREGKPTKRGATDVAGEILEYLSTSPRDFREISEAIDLPEEEIERILDSLERMGFVRKNAKITNAGLDFLVKLLDRMGFVKKKVKITEMGRDFLKLPGEEEERPVEDPSE